MGNPQTAIMDLRTCLLVSCAVLYASASNSTTDSRIFSNLEARIGAYPFIVQICRGVPDGGLEGGIPEGVACCVGTLLSEDYVMTSANCMSQVHMDYAGNNLAKGSIWLNTQTDADMQIVPQMTQEKQMKHIHAEFDASDVSIPTTYKPLEGGRSQRNNIAIIEIDYFSDTMGRYTFPEDFKFAKIPAEEAPSCMIFKTAGWGWDYLGHDASRHHNLMKEAYLPNIVTEECGDVEIFSKERLICAGCANGEGMSGHVGTCDYDWGGPLFWEDSIGDIWQYGIIAHTECSTQDTFGGNAEPYMFTKVMGEKDWICKQAVTLDCKQFDYQPVSFGCSACVDCLDCDSCSATEFGKEPTQCVTESSGWFGRNSGAAGMTLLLIVVVVLGFLLIGVIMAD